MISEKRLRANRANAQKSTGPRTENGKRRSSMNALKHGFTTDQSCIDEFEEALFPNFVEGMTHDLNPQNQEELALADTIITCHWRMRRVLRLETERLRTFLETTDEALGNAILQGDRYKGICALSMHESRIQRTMLKAYKELREVRKDQISCDTQTELPIIETAHHIPTRYQEPGTRDHPETNPTGADLGEPVSVIQKAIGAEAELPSGHDTQEQTQTEIEKTNPTNLGTEAPDRPNIEHGTSNAASKTNPIALTPGDEEHPDPTATFQDSDNPQSTIPNPKFPLTPHQQFSLGRLRVYQRGLYRASQMEPGPERDKVKWFNYNWILQVKATEDLSKIPPEILEFNPERDLPPPPHFGS